MAEHGVDGGYVQDVNALLAEREMLLKERDALRSEPQRQPADRRRERWQAVHNDAPDGSVIVAYAMLRSADVRDAAARYAVTRRAEKLNAAQRRSLKRALLHTQNQRLRTLGV